MASPMCLPLAYIILLALSGFGRSAEIEKVMPTRDEIETSINKTIEEVEKLVKENPSLPKLSRNDIVNILHNITSNDMSSIEEEAIKAIERTRTDYQRALMVVLPYKPKDSEESLKELYTKPPMTQIVIDESPKPMKDSVIQTVHNVKKYLEKNMKRSEDLSENKHQVVTVRMRFDDENSSTSTDGKNLDTATTTTTTTTTTPKPSKKESEPEKFSLNLNVKPAQTSYVPTKRPIYKGTFSRYRTSTRTPPKLEIIYTSTTKPLTTTKKPVTTTTAAPEKVSQNTLYSEKKRYHAPPKTTTATPTTEKPYNSPWKPISPSKAFFLPTVQSSSEDEPDFATLNDEDFKKVMETTASTPASTTTTTVKPAPIFVTPNVNSVSQNKVTTKIVPSGFKLRSTTATPTPMREEVEDLLKSIGLEPMKPAKPIDLKSIQNSVDTKALNALLEPDVKKSKVEPVKVDSSSIKEGNSFEAPQSPIKSGVKNLSPEIQLLFQQFGLPVSNQDQKLLDTTTTTTTTTTTQKPRITTPKVNSYTNFKPLPTSSVRDKDFRNFLARFGLTFGQNNQNRTQKAIFPRPMWKRPSLIDAVPTNMRKILENIGLIKKPKAVDQDIEIEPEASVIVEQTTTPPVVFKPKVPVVDDNQNAKIKNLLQTVRMVQEGKADVQDVQKVAHDLLQSTKSLENGPDPLKLEEILNNYRENLKNEVKRQQESTTTSTAAPTTTELDESTLSSVVTTDLSSADTSSVTKTDQSSSSSSTDAKTSKPSFFDTFDPFAQLNLTEPSTTTESSSSSTGKSNFFDTFDPEKFLKEQGNGTTSEDSGASISDLEDSFGGSTAKPDPVIPTRPKTGLYFLVDWNSFLEVGEEGNKDRVALRFQPKVGDRTRFLPVKIP